LNSQSAVYNPQSGEGARLKSAIRNPQSAIMDGPWIAVAVLAIVPHLGVLSNPFAFDDWSLIPGNPLLVHPQAIRKFFSENLMGFLGRVGTSGYYRPLQHLLNYVLFHLFGAHPGGFHAVSLVLHTGVSLLAFAVVRKLSRSHAVGFVAALLFAVHPAHTEVIAWVSSASDLLCTLFTLLAILCYLRSVESRGVARGLLLTRAGSEHAVRRTHQGNGGDDPAFPGAV